MFFKLSLTLLLVGFASAQVLGTGKCPEVQLLKKFDLPKYVGVWYEWGSYPTTFEKGLKCNTAKYAAGENGTVLVRNAGVNEKTGKEDVIEGYAKVLGVGELGVKFFPFQSDEKVNYQVLGVKYPKWAVVWSCQSVGPVNAKSAWLLTREAKPSKKDLADALKVFEDNNLSTKDLVQRVQDC